jgi:NitT/TauT family transport system substrate-binding protein
MFSVNRHSFKKVVVGISLPLALMLSSVGQAAPLKIGYSDWPGWVAWQVAIEKGWFKEADVARPRIYAT